MGERIKKKKKYWHGLLCSPPGDLPDLGIEPRSSAFKAGSLLSEPGVKPKE